MPFGDGIADMEVKNAMYVTDVTDYTSYQQPLYASFSLMQPQNSGIHQVFRFSRIEATAHGQNNNLAGPRYPMVNCLAAYNAAVAAGRGFEVREYPDDISEDFCFFLSSTSLVHESSPYC